MILSRHKQHYPRPGADTEVSLASLLPAVMLVVQGFQDIHVCNLKSIAPSERC